MANSWLSFETNTDSVIEDEDSGVIIGEYRVITTEKILSEKVTPVEGYLPPNVLSSRYIPGWKVSGLYQRNIFKDRGQKLDIDHKTYREKRKVKTALGKKGKKRQAKLAAAASVSHAFTDERFTPWQNELSQYVHTGNHVILDITTSCGKSWATTKIVAHETLSNDDVTAIFVSPNSEIMRDTVSEIRKYNYKHYLTSSKRMLDTQTRSYCTYDEKIEPISQIMCLTADNFVSFITNEINHEFIKKLQYIVFDEVHLNEVSATMWWSTFLPQFAQFLLLSATLGDVTDTLAQLRKNAPNHPIKIIKHNIRPIPLQRVLFKGCDLPKQNYRCPELKGAKRLSCQVNQFDPTARDIRSLDRSFPLSKDRIEQYHQGQVIVQSTDMSKIHENIQRDVDEAVVDPSPENIYKLLSYLFSNGMQPALVFHTSSAEAQKMAKNLVAYIAMIESRDDEFKKAFRNQKSLDKSEKRERDKRAEDEEKALKTGNKWSKMPEDESKTTDAMADLSAVLNKWKFPSQFGEIPYNIPAWVQDCLRYGIGVYLHSFPAWLRYKMFDAFKDGKLQVMIADATISVGINLPVRTCILCGDDITPALYKQMGGRAGRRGFDNQGYIIPMFNKKQIVKCLFTESKPVSINLPVEVSYTELVRLLTPGELANFYNPKVETDPVKPKAPGSQFSLPGLGEIPTLKDVILDNYREWTRRMDLPETLARLERQMTTIKGQMWHYHRLTNIIQSLPYNETMIFMQLLNNGDLRSITTTDMIILVACLFQTKPCKSSRDCLELPASISEKVVQYGRYFEIDRDFTAPVSKYFTDFFRKNEYIVEDIDGIEKIGEWLYILKRQLTAVAPRDNHIRKMVLEFDDRFMSACKATDLQ